MGKFLNKKEQVIDLKITSYGKNRLSVGDLKPEFYAFFDDNVIYDASYFGRTENQNDIHKRIKNETPYLEGQVLFKDIEKLPDPANLVEENTFNSTNFSVIFASDHTPTTSILRQDTFRMEQMIGDAWLEGETQNIPAWKLVALEGEISSSSQKLMSGTIGSKFDLEIPQINIQATYRLKALKDVGGTEFDPEDLLNDSDNVLDVDWFADETYMNIEQHNLMFYLEEANTIMLNENFELEVFQVDNTDESKLYRKEFKKDHLSLKGDRITDEYIKKTSSQRIIQQPTTNDVEYYFNILTDKFVDRTKACKGMEIYNKNSYYVDLDFECSTEATEDSYYYDIYGPVTEPEICQ